MWNSMSKSVLKCEFCTSREGKSEIFSDSKSTLLKLGKIKKKKHSDCILLVSSFVLQFVRFYNLSSTWLKLRLIWSISRSIIREKLNSFGQFYDETRRIEKKLSLSIFLLLLPHSRRHRRLFHCRFFSFTILIYFFFSHHVVFLIVW